jgi:ATP-dependent Lon protease
LFKIKVDNYNYTEKLEIANKHLINTILNKLNLSDSIQFSQEAISYLVKCSQNDEGMRDIKTKIKIILTRINTLLLTNPNDNIIRLKYRKLYSSYQTLPIIIPKEHIDIFLDESINMSSNNVPFGMYI